MDLAKKIQSEIDKIKQGNTSPWLNLSNIATEPAKMPWLEYLKKIRGEKNA